MDTEKLNEWAKANPMLFALIFLMGFLLLMFWARQHTGWNLLAKYYRAKRVPTASEKRKGSIGQLTLNGSAFKGASVLPTEEGLFLAFPIMGFLFPRLLIPWNALRDLETRYYPIVKIPRYECRIHTPEGTVRLGVAKRVLEMGKAKGIFS